MLELGAQLLCYLAGSAASGHHCGASWCRQNPEEDLEGGRTSSRADSGAETPEPRSARRELALAMAEAVISIKEGLAYIIKKGNRQAVASWMPPTHHAGLELGWTRLCLQGRCLTSSCLQLLLHVLCSDQYSTACRDVAWLCLVKASGAFCWGAADVLQVSSTPVQTLHQQAQILGKCSMAMCMLRV